MENDQLRQFIQQISREQEKKIAQEKRRNYFKEIGRKGGMKKKTSNLFTRVVSTRITEKEYEEIEAMILTAISKGYEDLTFTGGEPLLKKGLLIKILEKYFIL